MDVWSCGVILYALLCGTLPFDDENIPNLFKKIKSGMYSLPSHLSQQSRDLILRMLVVDPMKRISIPDIRQHPWFQTKLPSYLSLAPEAFEQQQRQLDEDIVKKVCQFQTRPPCTEDDVRQAVMGGLKQLGSRKFSSVIGMSLNPNVENNRRNIKRKIRHELRVMYELLLDSKRHSKNIADVMKTLQEAASSPPTGSPRILGLGTSPGRWTSSLRQEGPQFMHPSPNTAKNTQLSSITANNPSSSSDNAKRRR